MTITEWDAVSKQPHFKYAAVRVGKVTLATRAGDAADALARGVKAVAGSVAGAVGAVVSSSTETMHVGNYLAIVHQSEQHLAEALDAVAEHHGHEPDIHQECRLLASWSRANIKAVEPVAARYHETRASEPEKLHNALFHGPRTGGLGLVRDLHDLWLLAHEVRLSHEILLQAGQALRDREMETAIQTAMTQTDRQIQWLRSRIDQAAPQALAVRS